METLKLSVPNMKCMGCVNAITNGLKVLSNTLEVSTDIPSHIVTVKYDAGQLTEQEIMSKMKSLGYPAQHA